MPAFCGGDWQKRCNAIEYAIDQLCPELSALLYLVAKGPGKFVVYSYSSSTASGEQKMAVKNPNFQVYTGSNDKYYFRLTARNGEPILQSQGYEAKNSCTKGIQSVKANAPVAERFDKRVAKNGQPYFVLLAANYKVIGNSEMYSSEAARDNGIASVMKNAPDAPVEDLT
jgi:uncharacterized protein YegP (UPF0339 family)